MQTSFRQAPQPSFDAAALAPPSGRDAPRPEPVDRLPGGAVVRTRRTVLAGDELARLVAASGAARYVLWQRLARAHAWPAIVRARWAGELAMLVPVASPLALEAVFERPPAGATTLAVEEPQAAPWLVDDAGEHHAVELAVPFARADHAWSGRAGDDDGVQLAAAERRTAPA